MQLRPYQEDLIERTRTAMTKHRNVLMQAPTGAGKTALTVHMMATAASRGKTSMFIVHQTELLQQTSEALWNQKLSHGMIAPGKRKSKLPAQVASVQTLVRRLENYAAPDLIIIDECHRAAASTYQKVIAAYPRARVIGLTATPRRTDGKGLDDLFDVIVEGPTIRELIDAGFLADYELIAPPIDGLDVSDVKTKMGDYDKKELAEAVDKPTITGDAVNAYKRHTPGQRCVVMCVNIDHAYHVAEQYKASGVPAAVIEGKMTGAERQRIMRDFKSGEIRVVCNVQLLVEGVDLPSIQVVQWLRPTQSMIIWMQGNGRGLRPAPGKLGLTIIDHVQNWTRHGLPDDDREWSLKAREKGKRKTKEDEEAELAIQQCMNCYHVFKTGPDRCPSCGEALPRKARPEIEVIDGELEKIDVAQIRKERKKEQGQARTMRELIELGIRRGMKKPAEWSAITLAARQGKKPTPDMFAEARKIKAEIDAGENDNREAF